MRYATLLLLALLLLPSISVAGQLKDGTDAFLLHGDYQTAWKLLLPLANEGNAEAESYIGWMYRDGRGVKKDYAEALKWYRKAASQGYPPAERELGEMYFGGQGVQLDKEEGVKLLHKAALQGDWIASALIGRLYLEGIGVKQNYEEAFFWLSFIGPNEDGEDFAKQAAKHLIPNQLNINLQ